VFFIVFIYFGPAWGEGPAQSKGTKGYVNAHFITKENADPPNIYGGNKIRADGTSYDQHYWNPQMNMERRQI